MRVRTTTIAVSLLGAVVLVAALGEGAMRFTGPRWNFDIALTPARQHQLPSAPLGSPSPAPAPPVSHGTPLWLVIAFWVLVAVVVALLLRILFRLLSRRVRRAPSTVEAPALLENEMLPAPENEPEPDPVIVRRGIAQALHVLEAEREPGDAIVKAWLGLQESAEDAGITRRAAETPTEFTRRMLGRVTADTVSVDTVLRLYLRVRFGDHPAAEDDVAQVRRALERLQESWHAEAPA